MNRRSSESEYYPRKSTTYCTEHMFFAYTISPDCSDKAKLDGEILRPLALLFLSHIMSGAPTINLHRVLKYCPRMLACFRESYHGTFELVLEELQQQDDLHVCMPFPPISPLSYDHN